jgi:hypothetical protein
MAQISRNKKDSEWELILESGSNEIVLSDSDGGPNEDTVAADDNSN